MGWGWAQHVRWLVFCKQSYTASLRTTKGLSLSCNVFDTHDSERKPAAAFGGNTHSRAGCAPPTRLKYALSNQRLALTCQRYRSPRALSQSLTVSPTPPNQCGCTLLSLPHHHSPSMHTPAHTCTHLHTPAHTRISPFPLNQHIVHGYHRHLPHSALTSHQTPVFKLPLRLIDCRLNILSLSAIEVPSPRHSISLHTAYLSSSFRFSSSIAASYLAISADSDSALSCSSLSYASLAAISSALNSCHSRC